MSDSSRDDAPTSPPPAVRPARAAEPVSGLRTERDEAHDTDLTLEEHRSATDPDTLMSVPKPTPRGELPPEARLQALEERLETLESRLAEFERTHTLRDSARATPWWFWLLFLAGLAVTWRVLQMLR